MSNRQQYVSLCRGKVSDKTLKIVLSEGQSVGIVRKFTFGMKYALYLDDLQLL